MKLENKIRNLIEATEPNNESRFDVIAFELWGNSKDGFDCNDAWKIESNADIETVLESARARWEIFKVNYLPKACVKDIQDIGLDDNLNLEVDCVPFLEIRLA